MFCIPIWPLDIWAIGCIFAELLMLRPIFKGEEAKMDNKKNIPFQRDQVQKIFEILGTPQSKLLFSLAKSHFRENTRYLIT